jgi:hypothetical protein
MKLPWPLLSLLRRLTVLSLLLRARGMVLPSDCVEEEELLRLRTVWLGIVCVVVVGGLMLWLMLRLMCLVIVI